MGFFDFHTHVGKTEKCNDYLTVPALLGLMEREGIDRSVIIPNVSSVQTVGVLNRELLVNMHDCLRYRNVYFFALIDQYDWSGLWSNETKGAKFHPSISRVSVNDSSMAYCLGVLNELKLPLIVHCGRGKLSRLQYVYEVAEKYKDIKFIGAHLGGLATDLVEEALSFLAKKNKLDNLFLDTSAVGLPRLIKQAVDVLGKEHIMFGSDEPYKDIRVEKYCLELAGLSDKEFECVSYENACKLLGV